jgi:tRNA(Ile)-lysidine synthase
VRAWGECLHAARVRPALAPDWHSAWDGRAPLALPSGDALDCIATSGERGVPPPALALGPFQLAARQGGERIRLAGRTHSHAVKKCLQDLGVPPWERGRLPLVHAADGELLAVGDVLVSARLAAAGARFRLASVGGA